MYFDQAVWQMSAPSHIAFLGCAGGGSSGLASGGASPPVSGGASPLASGGASLLASGGHKPADGGHKPADSGVEPADGGHKPADSGGASPPAGGGVVRNVVLDKVGTLVRAVRATIAARPRLHCPLTKEAVDKLEEAVGKEFRTKKKSRNFNQEGSVRHTAGRKKKQVKGTSVMSKKCLQKQILRKDSKIKDLQAQLSAETRAKGRGGQITAEWLSRCAVAAPTVSLRSLVRSFKDIRGQDTAVVSRPTVKTARGALVKTLKIETGAHASRVVAADRARAEAAKHEFHFVSVVHSQDAADLRLRSREDYASGLPTRSRASNVLGQVTALYVGDSRISWPTELVALGAKDADTLVTALEKTLRDISDKAGFACGSLLANGGAPASSGEPAGGGLVWTWVLHILLQDGINTNMAAAAALRKVVSETPLGQRVRYFLVAMTCAAHTANLATGSVVQGVAAEIGDVCKSKLHLTIGGTAVRLYKYLLSDYWEEFVASTRGWVDRTLVVLSSDHRNAAHEDYMRRLQELYTTGVISDRCRRLFNGALKPLTHVVADGVDAQAERPAVVRDVVDFVVRDLFTVDERPTLSRMFSYRDCLDHMLTMHLLDIPGACKERRRDRATPSKSACRGGGGHGGGGWASACRQRRRDRAAPSKSACRDGGGQGGGSCRWASACWQRRRDRAAPRRSACGEGSLLLIMNFDGVLVIYLHCEFHFSRPLPIQFNFRIRVRNAPAHQISFMIVGPTLTCWGRVAKNTIWWVRSQTSKFMTS